MRVVLAPAVAALAAIQAAPAAAQAPPAYYCDPLHIYYPTVPRCPVPWRMVTPAPIAPQQYQLPAPRATARREPEQPTQNWQDWDASSGSSPAPNSLLAQWGRLNQQLNYVREHPPDAGYGGGGRCTYDPVVPRSQADAEWCRTKDQLEASLASLENQLKEQNWCRFQARTTWFPCNQAVNETEALAQFSEQDREFYTQQFIRAETVIVREMPGAPLSTVVKFSGGLLDPCRDPKVEGINCALTVGQRMDLLSQIVNYYNSLIPHYTLH